MALSSLVLLPWSLPVSRRMSFPLLPHPWGTSPEMRASETSSGQETPGDQDWLRLSWGSTERGLNLATLGRMPELLICSDLKPEPQITGRCSTQATPAGRTWETIRGVCWPARRGRGRLQKDSEMSSCSPPDPTSARLESSIGRLVQSSGFRKTTREVSFLFKITKRCVGSSLTQTQILSISPGQQEPMSNAKFGSVQRC